MNLERGLLPAHLIVTPAQLGHVGVPVNGGLKLTLSEGSGPMTFGQKSRGSFLGGKMPRYLVQYRL